MAIHKMTYRVPYADTDQMGVVYYANYLVYFERSRTEMLRDGGLSYHDIEERGFFLPVAEAKLKYKKAAHYDDLLTFQSSVCEVKGARLRIKSEVYRNDELLVTGYVDLACVNAKQRLAKIPDFMRDVCSNCLP